MQSSYSEKDKSRALQTLESIEDTIIQLIEWNKTYISSEVYYYS